MNYQRGSAKTILILFLFIGFWVWFFTKAPLGRYQYTLMRAYVEITNFIERADIETNFGKFSDEVTVNKVQSAIVDCDGRLPEQNKLYLASPDEANLKQKSRLFINNEHVFPIWITMFDADELNPASSFFINPGKHAKFKLPIGEYLIEIQSGQTWCNLAQGFEDPVFLEPDEVVAITSNEIKHISVGSYGNAPSDMLFIASQAGHYSGHVQGNGTLVLEQVLHGSYIAYASLNQKPATFIIDTGASITTVPYDFGIYAGVEGCEQKRFVTASGFVKACIGIADEVTVGHFILRNVKVAYGKGIPKDTFLLGMNVLKQFKIVQQSGSMVLSR